MSVNRLRPDTDRCDVEHGHFPRITGPREPRPIPLWLSHDLMDAANFQPVHASLNRQVETHERICDPDSGSVVVGMLGAVCVDRELVKSTQSGGVLQLKARDFSRELPALGGTVALRIRRRASGAEPHAASGTDGP